MSKTKIDNFNDEEFAKLVESSTSVRELSRKLGYTGGGYNGEAIKTRCKKLGISIEHFTGLARGAEKRTEENVFCENSTASQAVLRRWYANGQYSEYKCSICNLPPIWNDKPLTFTLDHINGINNDNRLENLRWVCPNCDRQLDTFCSKNVNRKPRYDAKIQNFCIDCGKEIQDVSTRCPSCYAKSQRVVERPDPQQLELDIRALGFSGTGRKYGVTDNSIRKWCKGYGMSTIAKDYK